MTSIGGGGGTRTSWRPWRPAAFRPPALPARRVRQAARAWVAAITVVLLGAALAGWIPQSPDSRTFETAAQLGTLATAAGGGLLAWRWEGIGGAILLVCGVALGVLASLQWPPLASLLVALGFIVPAIAYLALWQGPRPGRHLAVLAVTVALVLLVGGVASSRVYGYYFGPAHPQSDTALDPSEHVRWLWAGGATPDRFVVTVRFDRDDLVAGLRVADVAGTAVGHVAAPDWDGERRTATFAVSGLSPDTAYRYAVTVDDHLDPGATGRVRTFPAAASDITLAFSSCARVGSNGRVFDTIRALDPDLYLVTGDLHYGDVASDDPGAFHRVLQRTLAAPAQAALYRSVPTAYMWDDHDYGTNDGDRTATARAAALEVYRGAVPHYPLALPGDDAPVAQAFSLGRIRVLLTDLRSARDPGTTPQPSMLGADQLAWLDEELATAADEHALVVWTSSVPWIGAPSPGADDWSGYAAERTELGRMIADAGVPVLLLGGDAHMLAIDDGTHAEIVPGMEMTVFQAGALDRPGSVKGGPYSHGTVPGAGQFGVIDIRDDGGAEIEVTLTGRDWNDTELLRHDFTIPTPAEAARP